MQAVGMSPVHLLDELCKRWLPGVVEDYRLQTGRGDAGAVQIHEDMLPPKNPEAPDVPFVWVTLEEGVDGDDEASTLVLIIIGTYSEEDDGWREAKNIAFHIRHRLLEAGQVGPYRLLKPFRYKAPNQVQERTYPMHYMQLTTSWQMALVLPVLEEV